MPLCSQDSVDMIFSRVNARFCSLDAVPLAGFDLELVLVLYRVAKLVLKTRLNAKLLHAFSRALLQRLRVFAEYFENLPLFSEAFSLFNDNSFYGRMRFLRFNSFFELIDGLTFLGKEIEVRLEVRVYD